MAPQVRVLLLDIKLPRPDRDAASLRAAQMLAYLAERATVDLAVISDYGFGDTAVADASALGARLVGNGTPNAIGAPNAIGTHLHCHGSEYAMIVFAWSRTATAFMGMARQRAPQAGLVYDTHDVNHLREFRHARATGNAKRLRIALGLRDQERAAMREADCTIAITDADRAVLAKLAPEARIAVAGIWIDMPSRPRVATPKVGVPELLFIGHYQAAPNHDAALILAREVLPLVHLQRPETRLVLAGSDPAPAIQALAGPEVLVPGWEADLAPRLETARVFTAPLRFGSGLKGKILQAMAHGVPIVASTVAIEGTGLEDQRTCLVADTPRQMAAAILRLLAEPALGSALAARALGVLDAHFSRDVVTRQFDDVFAPFLHGGVGRPLHSATA